MKLAGKRVLVTGGSRGLGLSVAGAMAAAGAAVCAWGRDQEALAAAAESLKEVQGSCRFQQVDVRDEQAVVAASKALEPVDVLVNNAGIASAARALETPTQELEEILRTNVVGAFVVMREIARGMVANGGGLVINVESDDALKGIAGMGHYCASKHGLLGMGRSFAAELRAQKVRITTFCPGPISTDLMGAGTANPDYMDPDALAQLLVAIAALDPRIEIQDLLCAPMPPTSSDS